MAVYSYYYGANPENGIGVRAQTPELQKLPLASELQELASMHALESSEHSGEMLSFLLEKDGYSILGVSYIESPKSSGYNRSAPCSLQYIAPMQELDKAAPELSRIINFVNFQKPGSAAPQAMSRWPLNESGYYFHNSPSVLAPLVDGMVRVALSEKGETLLIGLPKGKNSEYAFARYTIAELMAYLPVQLRSNIHFFTGLPVAEGGDAVKGFDNALKYGANVIFCPNEHYKKIISSRGCIGVDMEAPGRSSGVFANYIAQVPDVSDGLASVDNCLGGKVTYEALNKAAQQAAAGEAVTIPKLRDELGKREKEIRQLNQQIENGNKEYAKLQKELEKAQRQQAAYAPAQGGGDWGQDKDSYDDEPGGGKKVLKWILLGLLGLALGVGGFFLGSKVFPDKKDAGAPAAQPAAVVAAPAEENKEEANTPDENASRAEPEAKKDDEAEQPGENTGDVTEQPGETAGDVTEQPGKNTGDGTEQPGETAGDVTEQPGENTGDETEQTGDTAGDETEQTGDTGDDVNEQTEDPAPEPAAEPDAEPVQDPATEEGGESFEAFLARCATLPMEEKQIVRNNQGYENEVPVNLYGVVTPKNGMNLREKNSAGSTTSFGNVGEGKYFWIIGEVPAEDPEGDSWYHVWYDDTKKGKWQEGYASSQYVKKLSEEESRAYFESHPVLPLYRE